MFFILRTFPFATCFMKLKQTTWKANTPLKHFPKSICGYLRIACRRSQGLRLCVYKDLHVEDLTKKLGSLACVNYACVYHFSYFMFCILVWILMGWSKGIIHGNVHTHSNNCMFYSIATLAAEVSALPTHILSASLQQGEQKPALSF